MRQLTSLLEVLKVLGIVLATATAVRFVVMQPFQVEGSSMEPNFHSGELILIEKVSYRVKQPKRGDVIVFRYPNRPNIDYIKRIVGLPGETVRIENGIVLINGQSLKETYLEPDEQTTVNGSDAAYELTLSQDQFFVMGDNRSRSSDSREWGPLDKRHIIGRSSIIFYPTNNFKAVASPTY